MDQETLREFESRCTQEEPPACQSFCPLHVEARTLAGQVAAGKVNEARKTLERHMPIPPLGGWLCEGPCKEHCLRKDLDQALDLPLLERFCLRAGRTLPPLALPATPHRAALVGSGLSSLAAAWELTRKGHRICLFHPGPPGASLRALPPELLPPEATDEALKQLAALKLSFEEIPKVSPLWLERLCLDFQAVFVGLDDPALSAESLGLRPEDLLLNDITRESPRKNLFLALPQPPSKRPFIEALSAGKKAAASVDRVLNGVAPGTAREKEAAGPTRLRAFPETERPKPPSRPADPLRPSPEEAGEEARRCLNCNCLECLKKCVYLRHYRAYPKKYAREIYNNISTVFGIRKANSMINSCAECGLCREICPSGADMGSFCAQARLEMVADRHMPVSAHEFALEDMLFSNSPEISFLRFQPGLEKIRWLFFPGCQLPASMPEAAGAVYAHLCSGLDGGVGLFFSCCGAPARWSGRPALTGRVAAGIREAWEKAGRPRMILACASCRLFFRAELPEIETVTLWSILKDLPCPSEKAEPERLALHDPCASRHDRATLESVRAILNRLGQATEEPPLSGRLTRCCGYGGLADQANPALGLLYARQRAEDTGQPLLAYCIMCRDRLRAAGLPGLHLLDLLFPASTFEAALERPSPGLSERREKRLLFRRGLLRKLWGESPPKEENMPEPPLEIAEELLPRLEDSRILRSDLAAVIRHAALHGPLFAQPEKGIFLAALRPRQVTFWVEYEERPDGSYFIRNAWRHRMLVPGVPGEGAESPATLEGFAAEGGRV
ncbi:MAG: 4Fe-4S dicluster domain-containing protein [Deltaproteobacteria bacterium]|jgi:Fe-S oxidoreductase|nr:4Fe-4S dicluster domain-containing protein [Deltaproteobacteria bacterium]